MRKTEMVLLGILLALVIIIASGTVWAWANGTRAQKKWHNLASANTTPSDRNNIIYEDIGRLRATSQDGAVIIAHIAWPMDKSERLFLEELRGKRASLKDAAISFFSQKESQELRPEYEPIIKAAIRDLYNSMLVSGQIAEIYLGEYAVIE